MRVFFHTFRPVTFFAIFVGIFMVKHEKAWADFSLVNFPHMDRAISAAQKNIYSPLPTFWRQSQQAWGYIQPILGQDGYRDAANCFAYKFLKVRRTHSEYGTAMRCIQGGLPTTKILTYRNYAGASDRIVAKQLFLNAIGYSLQIDGLDGRGTHSASKRAEQQFPDLAWLMKPGNIFPDMSQYLQRQTRISEHQQLLVAAQELSANEIGMPVGSPLSIASAAYQENLKMISARERSQLSDARVSPLK